tara:strand:+ start:1239 stop:1757 length:519 start_codon:yes stop_codon:yes gene_type:complete
MFKHRRLSHGYMARRKSRTKKTTRRSNRGAVNVVDLAQTYLQTGIITRAAFNTNPIEFVTGQQSMLGFRREGQTEVAYQVTGYFPNSNGTSLTLPELMGFDGGESEGSVSFGSGGMEAIRANIALNGGLFKPLVQTVVLNAGFTVGKKLFSKQRSLMNKASKMSGMASLVKF